MTYPSPTKTLLISKEDTWGTPVSATQNIGIITDTTASITQEIQESKSMGAITTQKVTGGMWGFPYSFTAEFQHGRILEYIFGSVSDGTTSSDEKHTFTISTTPPSATIEDGNNLTTDTVLTYEGMLVEAAEFTVGLNEVLNMKVDWKGENVRSSTSSAAASVPTLIVFPQALCHVSINGTEATEVQTFSIKITKKVELSGGIGSKLPQQGHATDIAFEFTGTLGFQDITFQELVLGGTSASAQADPTGRDVLLNCHNGVTLGNGRREFKLELENCLFTTFDEAASVGELTFIDLAGTGTLKECFTVDDIADLNA